MAAALAAPRRGYPVVFIGCAHAHPFQCAQVPAPRRLDAARYAYEYAVSMAVARSRESSHCAIGNDVDIGL